MTSDSHAGALETEPNRSGVVDRLNDGIERLSMPYPDFCLIVLASGVMFFQLVMVLSLGAPFWPLNLGSILNSNIRRLGKAIDGLLAQHMPDRNQQLAAI